MDGQGCWAGVRKGEQGRNRPFSYHPVLSSRMPPSPCLSLSLSHPHTLRVGSKHQPLFCLKGDRNCSVDGCGGRGTGFEMKLRFHSYLFFMSSENLILLSWGPVSWRWPDIIHLLSQNYKEKCGSGNAPNNGGDPLGIYSSFVLTVSNDPKEK